MYKYTYNMLIIYYLCNDLYVVCFIKYSIQFGGSKDKERYLHRKIQILLFDVLEK